MGLDLAGTIWDWILYLYGFSWVCLFHLFVCLFRWSSQQGNSAKLPQRDQIRRTNYTILHSFQKVCYDWILASKSIQGRSSTKPLNTLSTTVDHTQSVMIMPAHRYFYSRARPLIIAPAIDWPWVADYRIRRRLAPRLQQIPSKIISAYRTHKTPTDSEIYGTKSGLFPRNGLNSD